MTIFGFVPCLYVIGETVLWSTVFAVIAKLPVLFDFREMEANTNLRKLLQLGIVYRPVPISHSHRPTKDCNGLVQGFA